MTQRLAAFLSRPEIWMGGIALAVFLVLYWALRGAPIGQAATEEEAEDAPRSGYRDRVVAAVVVGLLLVLAGAYVALTSGVRWSLPLFALGFGLVLTLVAVNRRYRHGSPSLRRTVEFAHSALTASLIAGILIVLNVLAFRYGGRALDFTRERTFSLSSLTVNQVKSLNRPVTLTVFFGAGPRAVRQLDRVQQLLELYKAANPSKIALEFLNPDRDLEKYEALVKRVPDLAVIRSQGGGILIEYGEGPTADRLVVRNSDLFEVPRVSRRAADPDRFESTFNGEDAVTSALIRLRGGKKPIIAFTTGHGEPALEEIDPRKPGIGLWKSRLTTIGADVVELNLIRQEIAAETALLIVVAPRSPLKSEEVAKVRAFMDRGKPLLVIAGNSEKTGLDDVLRSCNVEIGPGLIVDPALNYNRRVQLVFVPIMGLVHHPIVDSLLNRAVLTPNAAPIRVLGVARGTSPVNPGLVPVPILRTSGESWAETDLSARKVERNEGRDEPGPLTVGVAVADRPRPGNDREPTPRLVLLSSRYLAENPFIELEPTNLDVLMNAVNWLRGRPDLRGIAPKKHVALTLSSDPVLRARLILVPTTMAVVLIIGLGLSTYMARRA